ncbi:hypothetical protein AVEN_89100-1 [Araneus ventricosus]|uniref:Uncharacterized protein n=1 Tax=Araneus ventricosus TaxID=182803 RepID=A0A4Y2B242_ARAVE|nr:hypothetical protein AVEN_89100-1 [Araneus ventricosus]
MGELSSKKGVIMLVMRNIEECGIFLSFKTMVIPIRRLQHKDSLRTLAEKYSFIPLKVPTSPPPCFNLFFSLRCSVLVKVTRMTMLEKKLLPPDYHLLQHCPSIRGYKIVPHYDFGFSR